MDAITLICADHRKVAELFERYRTKGTADPARRKIARDITRALTEHATAEEQVMYPEARAVIEDAVVVDDARAEHREMRRWLANLDSLDWRSAEFEQTMLDLIESVEHHVADEEQTILPALRGGVTVTGLEEMGVLMEKAKRTAPKRPPRTAKSPTLLLSDAADAAIGTARKAVSAVRRAMKGGKPKKRSGARRRARTTAKARSTQSRARSTHSRARARRTSR